MLKKTFGFNEAINYFVGRPDFLAFECTSIDAKPIYVLACDWLSPSPLNRIWIDGDQRRIRSWPVATEGLLIAWAVEQTLNWWPLPSQKGIEIDGAEQTTKEKQKQKQK